MHKRIGRWRVGVEGVFCGCSWQVNGYYWGCRVGKAEYTCQKPAGWAFETGCVAYWSSNLSNGRICDSRKDYTVLVKVLRLCDEQNDLNRRSSRSAVDEAHLSTTTAHMTTLQSSEQESDHLPCDGVCICYEEAWLWAGQLVQGEEKGETDLDSVQFLDLVRLVDLVQSSLDVDACIQYPTRFGLQFCIRGIGNHPCRRTYYIQYRRGPIPKNMQIESTIVFVLYVDTGVPHPLLYGVQNH